MDISHPQSPREVAAFITKSLKASADPDKAVPMARYMKTDMPFYGVQKSGREKIARAIKWHYRPGTFEEYLELVNLLWSKEHREEKYLAIQLARTYRLFITTDSLELYERLIREGAWWDFVDEIAIKLIGPVLRNEPEVMEPVLDEWIEDENMWIRRAALLSQVLHRDKTDKDRLFRYCKARLGDDEKFVQKAIGWALRDYSRANSEAVRSFLMKHGDEMSELAFREAARVLNKKGYDLKKPEKA